jgi:translation elongation factor P/translation initiation factor 5A
VTLEERLLYIAEDPFGLCDKNSLRKIALEVRKMNDRIQQLETENDAMRADLLLWNEQEVKL